MTVEPVTPIPAINSEVAVGGTPVTVFLGGPNGGIITNPASPDDQNIGGGMVENLYVNPVTDATLIGNGTTFSLQPGQSWSAIPGQTTRTSVNAFTSGHRFSAFSW